MNNGYVEVDSRKINFLFDSLKMSNKEAKAAVKGGLRKSARIIQKQARMNLKGVRNEATGKTLNSKNILQFVNLAVYKNASGARVDVMDDKRKSTNARLERKGMANKSFILKFFAAGTEIRFTKSHKKSGFGRKHIKRSGRGGFRGKIGNSQFFKKAVDAKKKEAEEMLEDSIVEFINKVVKRRR